MTLTVADLNEIQGLYSMVVLDLSRRDRSSLFDQEQMQFLGKLLSRHHHGDFPKRFPEVWNTNTDQQPQEAT